MPGPVSDSYDSEFSTGANAADVAEATREVVARIGALLGEELRPIVAVVQGEDGPAFSMELTECELRIIRFNLNRSLETI